MRRSVFRYLVPVLLGALFVLGASNAAEFPIGGSLDAQTFEWRSAYDVRSDGEYGQ